MKKCCMLLLLVFLLSGCREELPAPGWAETSTGLTYLDLEGAPVMGWQTINGYTYYFDPERSGAMVTGWLMLPEGRYYFDGMGILHTGWLELPEGLYYMTQEGAMAVGAVEIQGVTHYFTADGTPFLLVNRWNSLPEGYEPHLTEVDGFRVAEECAAALRAMMLDCREAGHRCEINSAYRDVTFQQMLWDNRYNGYLAQGYSPQEAADLSAQIVLPPGTSEHHTGLAIDITGTDEMYRWLATHAPEYGFILRYPEGKTDFTGVIYEPWHFRYVGIALAQELQTLDMTLEEYFTVYLPS